MKVLLLTPSFPPELNSAARVFSELAEDLKHSGHVVTVVTRVPGPYVATHYRHLRRHFVFREKVNEVNVWRRMNLPTPRRFPLARIIEQVWMTLTFFALARGFPRQDAVIVYSPPLPLGLAGYWLARLWRGALILNVQDLYPQTAVDLGLLRNRFLIALAERLERFVYRRSDAITVHSEGNRRVLLRKGIAPHRIHVIPNWVDLQVIAPGPREDGWRRRYGWEDAFIVSFAGTMGFAQGLGDMLRVVDELCEYPQIKFVLAGEGAFRGSLEKWVRARGLSNIQFLPPQSPEAYLSLLRASDVCLVVLHKNLRTPLVPGKLPVIMAAGRPVICFTNPASDARRVIEEAGCGFFVSAGDTRRLAEVLLYLYNRPDLIDDMGRKGRFFAEEYFDRQKCTHMYNQLLSSLKRDED